MKLKKFVAVLLLVLFIVPQFASSHCEIPCGIYGDEARFDMLNEHITTIEKSMNKIVELSAENPVNYNQLVRWINNKEDHANKFMDIVTQYFMTQRIKEVAVGAEGYDKYVKKITLLHEMLRVAMKCKQTTDTANTDKLTELVSDFHTAYTEGHSH